MATRISEKELNNYYAETYRRLKLTHTSEEAKNILSMLKESATNFCIDNPEATMEDFKAQFGGTSDITDILINEEDSGKVAGKISNTSFRNKVFLTILLLAVLVFCIKTGLYIKSYIDYQNTIVTHEIIVIE